MTSLVSGWTTVSKQPGHIRGGWSGCLASVEPVTRLGALHRSGRDSGAAAADLIRTWQHECQVSSSIAANIAYLNSIICPSVVLVT